MENENNDLESSGTTDPNVNSTEGVPPHKPVEVNNTPSDAPLVEQPEEQFIDEPAPPAPVVPAPVPVIAAPPVIEKAEKKEMKEDTEENGNILAFIAGGFLAMWIGFGK